MSKNITLDHSPLLVFGGVYSNLEALDKMIELAEELEIDPSSIICTGDIVGYCADPEVCLQRIKSWGIHAILGNVEEQLINDEDDCGCNFNEGGRCDLLSKQWFPYAKEKVSQDSLDWLSTLPSNISFQAGNKKMTVVHGSVHKTAEYIFASTDWEVKQKNFEDTESDVIIAGHSGIPFHQERANKTWLNAGVIGLPANDGTPRVWYMLIDFMENGLWRYEHASFEYDHIETAFKMQKAGLPLSYAKTLSTGLWDNCEILPTFETRYQGKALPF